jgi:hypothetical protein
VVLPDGNRGDSLRRPNIDHRAAADGHTHERSMKQFLNTQVASMTRTVAADSLRPYCAELLF